MPGANVEPAILTSVGGGLRSSVTAAAVFGGGRRRGVGRGVAIRTTAVATADGERGGHEQRGDEEEVLGHDPYDARRRPAIPLRHHGWGMDVDASIEQVTGILVREGLRYQMSEDGRTYRLLFGSAAVFIDFDAWQDDGVVITVHSPVLQDIDPESAGRRAGAEPAQRPQPQLLLRQVHVPRRDPDRPLRPARGHAAGGRAGQRAVRDRGRGRPARRRAGRDARRQALRGEAVGVGRRLEAGR